jgi:hypothetical protein
VKVVRRREKVGATRGRQVNDIYLKAFVQKERSPSRLSIWLGCLDLLRVIIKYLRVTDGFKLTWPVWKSPWMRTMGYG